VIERGEMKWKYAGKLCISNTSRADGLQCREGRESHFISFVGVIHNEIFYRIAETFEVGGRGRRRRLQYENIWPFRSKPSTYNEITVCVFFVQHFNDLGIPMMHAVEYIEYANIICSIRL
jgi:hypothetical protein